jgi:hypothetical protein
MKYWKVEKKCTIGVEQQSYKSTLILTNHGTLMIAVCPAPGLNCYVWSAFHHDSNRLHVPNYWITCNTLVQYDPIMLAILRINQISVW